MKFELSTPALGGRLRSEKVSHEKNAFLRATLDFQKCSFQFNSFHSFKKQSILKLKSGLPGPKKLKRPNLAISSFKKAKFSKMIKGQIKAKFSSKICLNN